MEFDKAGKGALRSPILSELHSRVIIKGNKLFIKLLKAHSAITRRKSLRILFSPKPDWEPSIVEGFENTSHEITFAKITAAAIKEYDLIVPLRIDALEEIESFRDLLASNPLPIPSLRSVRLCDDKASFNRHLVDIGLGGFLPDVNSPRSFPYILKKRIDEWAENCHIVFDREQEKILYNSIRNPSEYFSQELVPGSEEFATHLIIKNGSIKCAINIKYKFKHEFPIKGKDPLIYASIWPSYYLDVFASILRSIGFEGLCCVNYKILGGRPKILEINPRFGGSLAPYFFRFAEKICAGAEATSEAAPAATSPTH